MQADDAGGRKAFPQLKCMPLAKRLDSRHRLRPAIDGDERACI